MVTHQQYSKASDVYSFGVILWELLTWKLPWENLGPFQVRLRICSLPACCDACFKVSSGLWAAWHSSGPILSADRPQVSSTRCQAAQGPSGSLGLHQVLQVSEQVKACLGALGSTSSCCASCMLCGNLGNGLASAMCSGSNAAF